MFVSVLHSIYVDKSKVSKITDKSGAAADLLDLYTSDGTQSVDIYQDRWPYAEHMNFFIPACARSANTVSIGGKKTKTNLKSQLSKEITTDEYDEDSTPIEWLNYVCFLL